MSEFDDLEASAPEPSALPRIRVGRQLRDMVDDAVRALVQRNMSSPCVFRYVDVLARVSRLEDEDGRVRAKIKQYTQQTLIGELSRAADWYGVTAAGLEREKTPDSSIAGELHGSADLYTDIPALDLVVGCPIFSRDGELQTEPGYSSKTRAWYEPMDAVRINPVPLVPTQEDVEVAKKLLLEDYLGDFPFEGAADVAHAVGFLITLVTRKMVSGPIPMHGFDAPTEGTGKTLLVETVLSITNGSKPLLYSAPRSDDDAEWDKRITSSLLAGRNAIVWDNVNDNLSSASLAKLLTADTYGSRLLGLNKDLELPVRAAVVYTGNNVVLTREMARRTVRCRLNTHTEIPSQGRQFRHDPLDQWVMKNRGDLLWSVYVLVQHWLSSGRKGFTGEALGSYGEWSRLVGGVLQSAGITGFLENREQVYAQVEEGSSDQSFVEAWFAKYADAPIEMEHLIHLTHEYLGMKDKSGFGLPKKEAVGYRLGKMKDRVYGDYEIYLASNRPRKWAVRKTAK